MKPDETFYHIDEERAGRLYAWQQKKPSPPIQIDVELHKRCNLNCRPCSRQSSDKDINKLSRNHEMPTAKWLALVNQAADLGIQVWNIEGANEPMAKPDLLVSVLKEVKKRKIFGILTTNGTLWKDEYLRLLVEIGWDRVHFSIDSHLPEVHDHLRRKTGAFHLAVEAVKGLNRWKQQLKSDRPMINFNIIINKNNYQGLTDYVEFAHELGCEYIFTEPLIVFDDECEALKLSDQEMELLPDIVTAARSLCEKYGIDNNFFAHGKNLGEDLVKHTSRIEKVLMDDSAIEKDPFLSSPCFKPFDNMTIKMDGLCGHCGLIMEGENVKDKTLEQIWYGDTMNALREQMLAKQLSDHCRNCCPSDISYRRRLRDKFRSIQKSQGMGEGE